MAVVEHRRAWPTLKQMTAKPILTVEPDRKQAMTSMEGLPDGVFAFRDRNEVHVIGHQAVGANIQTEPTTGLNEQVDIEVSVAFVAEDIETSDPSLSDVVREPRKHNPSDSWHWFFVGTKGRTASGNLNLSQNVFACNRIITVCVPEIGEQKVTSIRLRGRRRASGRARCFFGRR